MKAMTSGRTTVYARHMTAKGMKRRQERCIYICTFFYQGLCSVLCSALCR